MTPGPARAPVVLVLRALGLGDVLTAVPALRALRRAFPGHRVVLACPPGLAPLVQLAGAVDAVLPAAPLRPLPPLPAPAVAVNLHGRGPQSHRLLQALRPRRLVAFGSAEAGVEGPEWRAGEHEVARLCRLLAESGIPADPADLRLRPPPLPAALAPLAGATVIHPGAASGSRRWPPERFAAVVRAEAARGRAVAVTGGVGEADLARRVAGRSGAAVLAGRTDLLGLAALVGAAGRVVCGDTGVAHLATAMDTPSVVLFGPVPPAEWGPPAADGRHVALWHGGRGDPHASAVDPGLATITVDEVLAALRRSARFAAHPHG